MKFSQKMLRIGNFEKLSFFESAILDSILMLSLVSSKVLAMHNITLYSVCIDYASALYCATGLREIIFIERTNLFSFGKVNEDLTVENLEHKTINCKLFSNNIS